MSLWDDILKRARGAVAQVNPFDGGETYDSVVNGRSSKQGQPAVVRTAVKRSPAVQPSPPKVQSASAPKLGVPTLASINNQATPMVVKQTNPTTPKVQPRPQPAPAPRPTGPKLGVPLLFNDKTPTGQPAMQSPVQPKLPQPKVQSVKTQVPQKPVVDPKVQNRKTVDDIMVQTEKSAFPTLGGRSLRSFKDQYNSLDAMQQRQERKRLTDLASIKLTDKNYDQKQAREEARVALAVLTEYGQDKYDFASFADDALNFVPNMAKGVVDTYSRVGGAQARVLEETFVGGKRKAQEDRQQRIQRLNNERAEIRDRDPRFQLTGVMSPLVKAQYDLKTRMLQRDQDILSDELEADYDMTDPTKYLGAGASVLLDALTAGAVGNVGRIAKGTGNPMVNGAKAILDPQTMKQALGSGAVLGSGYGVTSAVQERGSEVTPEEMATGAAMGALGGVAFAGTVAGLSRALHKLPQEIKNRTLIRAADGTEPVTVDTKNLITHEDAPVRSRIEEYKARIQNGGQIEPLVLMRDEDGKLSVEDGKHRLVAMNELGIGKARAFVVTPERVKQIIAETSDAMPENVATNKPMPTQNASGEMPALVSSRPSVSSVESVPQSINEVAYTHARRAAEELDVNEEFLPKAEDYTNVSPAEAVRKMYTSLTSSGIMRTPEEMKELLGGFVRDLRSSGASDDFISQVGKEMQDSSVVVRPSGASMTRQSKERDDAFLSRLNDPNLADDQRLEIINSKRAENGLEPITEEFDTNATGEKYAKPEESFEMTKGNLNKENDGFVLSQTKDGLHRRRVLRNGETGVAEVIVETKQPDGSWQRSKEREPAIAHRNDFRAIDNLEDNKTLTEAAQKAMESGDELHFYAAKQTGDPNNLSAEIIRFDPEKMVIDGGFVRDAKTNAILGNHIKVDDTGISINIGKNIVNMDGIVGDASKWRNMNKISYTLDRILEMAAPTKEIYRNVRKFVIEHKQSSEANMRTDLSKFRDDIANWKKDILAVKPKNVSEEDFKTDAFFYAERKLAQPTDMKGVKMNQDQILNAKYGEAAANKIREFDKWARQQYDSLLDRTNEVLREFGHDEVPKRKNYMTHLQEDSFWDQIGIGEDLYRDLSSGIQGEANVTNRGQLPGTIAGRTENFRPTKKYNPFHQTRRGTKSMTDPFKAMDAYGEAAMFNIHMTESAVRARSLEAVFRTAEEIVNRDMLQQVREDLKKNLIEAHKGQRPDLVVAFQEYANALAGKSNSQDRWWQDRAGKGGRITLAVARKLQKIASNASIIGNASVTIAQALNLPNVIKTNGGMNVVRAMSNMINDIDIATGLPKAGTPASESDFLRVRYTDARSRIDRTKLEIMNKNMTRALFMEQFERTMTESTWYSSYEKAIRSGYKGNAAVKEADRMTERLVAGRGIADQPEMYRSTVGRTFLQYTLEVNAALKNLRFDNTTPATVMKYAAAVFIMNKMVETVTGRAPLPDFVGATVDTVGDLADLESYDEESLWDKTKQGAQRFTEQAVKLSPLTSSTMQFLADDAREALFGDDSDFTRYDGSPAAASVVSKLIHSLGDLSNGNIAGAWDEVLAAVPYGSQIRKTGQGVDTMMSGYSKDGQGNPAAKVDTSNPLVWLQAALFGKNAIPEVKEYYSNKMSALGDKQTETFKKLEQTSGKDAAINYLSSVQHRRTEAKDNVGNTLEDEDIKAEKDVKLAEGAWQEKDGVVVDADSGEVVKSYYQKLAKKAIESNDRSDTAYDAILKANGIKTAGEGKYKETGHTTLDKLNKLNNIADQKDIVSEAIGLIKNMGSDDKVPKWAVTRYLKDNKIDQGKAVYATKASYSNDVKLPVIKEEIKSMDHGKVLEYLTNGRIKSIGGDYWVTQGVLASLRDEGVISKTEYTRLNKSKYSADGKYEGETGSGGGRGGAKVSASELGALTSTVNIEQAIANIISEAGKRKPSRKIDYKKRT